MIERAEKKDDYQSRHSIPMFTLTQFENPQNFFGGMNMKKIKWVNFYR